MSDDGKKPDNSSNRLGNADGLDRGGSLSKKQLTRNLQTSEHENDVKLTEIPDTASSIGGWMIILLWVMALAMATYLAQNWLDKRAEGRQGTWVTDEQGQQAILLRANRYGQYRVRGSANGQEVLFLVDTGASGISIPDSVAQSLGLRRGRAFDVSTANGTTTVYATRLKSLSIGPLIRTDVTAHINPGMDGETALLGMSFLRDFEIVHRDGEMIIRE